MIIVNFRIAKELYYNSDMPHNIELITTEYSHRNDILAYIQTGKNLIAEINNIIQYQSKQPSDLQNEQYFIKKSYHKNKIKQITRGTFEKKLKNFDMSHTFIEQEFVEEYAYNDKNGKTDSVKIIITANNSEMKAVIDFKDAEQNINFVCPEWLIESIYN